MIQNPFFQEIHGNFGFGCMRLPMKDGKVNYDEFCRMADAFITSGLNYFDTAHGYIGGQSEGFDVRFCFIRRIRLRRRLRFLCCRLRSGDLEPLQAVGNRFLDRRLNLFQ